MIDRGGKGSIGIFAATGWKVTRPETDGRGCPWCGAIRGGGHGGGCPNAHMRFDEDGRVLASESWEEDEDA
jgi:hypothetical protein